MVGRQKITIEAYFEPESDRLVIPLRPLPEWLRGWISEDEDIKVIQELLDDKERSVYIEVKNATKRIPCLS